MLQHEIKKNNLIFEIRFERGFKSKTLIEFNLYLGLRLDFWSIKFIKNNWAQNQIKVIIKI